MQNESLSVTLAQASQLIGMSVVHLRVEMGKGKLKAKKNGRKVMILRSDLEQYYNSLPDWTPGEEPVAASAARRKARA